MHVRYDCIWWLHSRPLYYRLDMSRSNITRYWIQCENKNVKSFSRSWTHKKIPHIARHYGRSMGHLFWLLPEKIMMTSSNETFSALLAICAGNSPVTGEFPAQRPMTRSLDVFFDLGLSRQLSKQCRRWWFETLPRSLLRHCNVTDRYREFTVLASMGYQYFRPH